MSPSILGGGLRRLAPVAAALAALVLVSFSAVVVPRPTTATTCPAGTQCSRLEFDLSGTGSGNAETVTAQGPADGYIDCVVTLGAGSGTCAHVYEWAPGTGDLTVYAQVIPAYGSVVCYQNGTCLDPGYSLPLTFSLTNGVDRVWTGSFKLENRHLVVHIGGDEQGAIKATNIESIDCPASDCSWDYPYGTSITLRAVPVAGHVFNGWSGACANHSGDCQITMDDDKSVTADFEPAPSSTTGAATPKPTHTPGTGAASAAPTLGTETPAPSAGPATPGATGTAAPGASASPAGTSSASSSGPPLAALVALVLAAVLIGGGGGILLARRRS